MEVYVSRVQNLKEFLESKEPELLTAQLAVRHDLGSMFGGPSIDILNNVPLSERWEVVTQKRDDSDAIKYVFDKTHEALGSTLGELKERAEKAKRVEEIADAMRASGLKRDELAAAVEVKRGAEPPKRAKPAPRESKVYDLGHESFMVVEFDAVTDVDFEAFCALPYEQTQITLYGKTHDTPRLQKLYGVANYAFSTYKMVAEPIIPPPVQACIDYARLKYPKFEWNGALVNYYADGNNYIAAHSDDEKDLQSGAPILSFSFGATRTFRITKKNKEEKYRLDVPTESGSMIAMCGQMQKFFKHEIVKAPKIAGRRINVTVRCFKN